MGRAVVKKVLIKALLIRTLAGALLIAVSSGWAASSVVKDTGVVSPDQHDLLVIGVEDSWPPFADEQGEGISTDIVKAAFDAVGVPIQLMVMPYARVLRDIQAGVVVAGYNVSRQDSTEKRFIFGKTPIMQATASFYYSTKSSDDYASADDIADGDRVALILDYEYGDVYDKQQHRFQEFRVTRQNQIVRMLLANRVDVGIMFDRVAEQTLRELGLPATALRKGAPNHVSDIYVAFSRKNPKSEEYAALLDLGLAKIKENGLYDKLLAQSQ